MPLVIIYSYLVPVKIYNKFNQGNVQKINTEDKIQDICPELTATSGHQFFSFFF